MVVHYSGEFILYKRAINVGWLAVSRVGGREFILYERAINVG